MKTIKVIMITDFMIIIMNIIINMIHLQINHNHNDNDDHYIIIMMI